MAIEDVRGHGFHVRMLHRRGGGTCAVCILHASFIGCRPCLEVPFFQALNADYAAANKVAGFVSRAVEAIQPADGEMVKWSDWGANG